MAFIKPEDTPPVKAISGKSNAKEVAVCKVLSQKVSWLSAPVTLAIKSATVLFCSGVRLSFLP